MAHSLRFLLDSDRKLLARATKLIRFGPGETILKEGERTGSLYSIRSGIAGVEMEHFDGGVEIATMGADAMFGEMSFLEDQPASATVVAKTEVELEVVDVNGIAPLLDAEPALAARFYRSLAVALSSRLRERTALVVPPFGLS